MNVGQLVEILGTLSDDMPVLVRSTFGEVAHLDMAVRGVEGRKIRFDDPHPSTAHLLLGGHTAYWLDEPEVELVGPWKNAARKVVTAVA